MVGSNKRDEIKQFDEIMKSVDDLLRKAGIPIYQRPGNATAEAGKRLNIETIICIGKYEPTIEGKYNSRTLYAHVNHWYELRYGDRLKRTPGPGSVAILIKGDAWRLRLPPVRGLVGFTIDPDYNKYPPRMQGGKESGPVFINIISYIEDCPAGLVSQLTLKEKECIVAFFVNSLETLEELTGIWDKPFVSEALGDLESAVTCLLADSPQYGLSRYASLQFIEKLFKCFLELKVTRVPHHHKLSELKTLAESAGLIGVNSNLLDRVQCSAGVRYGEISVSLEEAISAHHASLTLCKQIISNIMRVQ
jgi:hypothetical protein